MIASVIAALIGNYMTTCFVIGLIVGAAHILRSPRPHTAASVSGLLLNAYLLWAVGVGQAINFVMHSVFGDVAARSIGWAQSPFQLELAFSSLGTAVVAIMVHGVRGQFRAKAAVVIATAIFSYGAAGGHIYQLIVHHDLAANNIGLLLAMDIVIPTVGLVFVIWHAASRRGDSGSATDADVASPPAAGTAQPVPTR